MQLARVLSYALLGVVAGWFGSGLYVSLAASWRAGFVLMQLRGENPAQAAQSISNTCSL